MIAQVGGSAAAIVAASLLLGYAANALGLRCRAAAPAVGLGLSIIVSYVVIRITGEGTPPAAVLLALMVGAAVVLAVRLRASRARRSRRDGVGGLVGTVGAGAVALAGASLPFLANGRVGLLGVSLDNDTANHLIWTQALRSAATRHVWGLPNYYPLGPHSLVAAVSTGIGARLDAGLDGLLVAGVILTALLGANALGDAAWWKRIVSGALASLLYLVAAYYAEAAFKEQLLGLLLLAFVLQLEQTRREWAPGLRARAALLAPAAVVAAAMFYVFGYPAIPWLALTLAIWLIAEVLVGRIPPRVWIDHARRLAPAAGIGLLVLVLLLVPVIQRNIRLYNVFGASPSGTGAITTSNVGNLAHQLPFLEALGIWNNPDFRFSPPNPFHAGELAAFALAVLIFGLLVSMSRRELVLPAAVVACGIIAWRAGHGQSPYVAAKALVIAGPVIAIAGMRGLLYPLPGLGFWLSVLRLAALVAFLVFAFHSSYQALRNEPVWPSESTKELLALGRITRGETLLDLVNTDYAQWLFNDSYMSSIAADTPNLAQAAPRPGKPFVYGRATDFDSISDQSLGTFQWAVTTNSPYASQPPSAYRLVRTLPMYQLWRRVGQIAPRRIIEKPGAPGAVLDCHTPGGRAISRARGVAAVMPAPIFRPLGYIGPGASLQTKLTLPPGMWELSLQYLSGVALHISGGGERWSMPAYLDRPGPWFAMGTIEGTGSPITLTLHADQPESFSGPALGAQPTGVAATRLPDTRTLVPLRRACGRYVDWYRVR